MDERDGFVVIDFDRVKTNTASAVLLEIEDLKHWIPLSVIGQWDEEARQVEVAEWFAEKEGLI